MQYMGRSKDRPAVSSDPDRWPGVKGYSITCGRKVCPSCTWRHVMDFGRRPNGTLESHCRTCVRVRKRVTNAAAVGRDEPYGQREVIGPAERRRRRNEDSRRRNRTASRREYQRIYQAERRRAKGIPARQMKKNGTATIEGDNYNPDARDFVPSGPFIEWLKGVRMLPAQIANAARIDSARIYMYYGPDAPESVSIGFVDRVMHAVRAVENLNDLYPLDA